MTGRNFFSCVQKHLDLKWLGVIDASDEVVVRHTSSGTNHVITVKSVLNHSWSDLEGVLMGRRDPKILRHITRIVGYYSRISNWSGSALAQLRDRHKGQYGLPESISTPPQSYAPVSHVVRAEPELVIA